MNKKFLRTRINYDILTYLPQDLDSRIGEVALEDDFHLASTGMIVDSSFARDRFRNRRR